VRRLSFLSRLVQMRALTRGANADLANLDWNPSLRDGDRRECRLRSSSTPAVPTGPTDCTFTVTMTSFTTTPSPAQGTRYEFFFSSTILASTAAVYLVDVNAGPVGCTTAWTAVSANRDAVQLSPAGGSGRGQVELFIPQNPGVARSTAVTIAGLQAIVSQAGR
jgi:hypothetical protein